MIFLIEDLEKEGPREVRLPINPKTSLKALIKNKRPQEPKPKFDLHDYLCRNLISPTENCPTVSQQRQQGQQFASLEDVLSFLQNGYKVVKIQNSNTLSTYIDYGVVDICTKSMEYCV